jgi:DNA topoisomerase-1
MAVTDGYNWWSRVRVGKRTFRYFTVANRPLADARAIQRVSRLAIPPAWNSVHISPDPHRRVQAWGIDGAGRKQYIYSSAAVQERELRRWSRVSRYGESLPRLRQITNEHLRHGDPDRAKVSATVLRLISRAFFRIGSERYAVQNRTFGIATLYKRHIRIDRNNLIFTFTGKQKKLIRRIVADTPLVEIIAQLLELPGRRLFRYRNGAGLVRNVTADSVNEYLQDITGEDYTAKDLRTFGGTVRAATILADIGPPDSEREARRNAMLCCRLVASELHNTPAIARASYIHPAVLGEYVRNGRTIAEFLREPRKTRPLASSRANGKFARGLRGASAGRIRTHEARHYPEETALLRFLERWG